MFLKNIQIFVPRKVRPMISNIHKGVDFQRFLTLTKQWKRQHRAGRPCKKIQSDSDSWLSSSEWKLLLNDNIQGDDNDAEIFEDSYKYYVNTWEHTSERKVLEGMELGNRTGEPEMNYKYSTTTFEIDRFRYRFWIIVLTKPKIII